MAALLASTASSNAKADPSLADLAAKINQLEAENHQMKAAIAAMRSDQRHTQRRVEVVAQRTEHFVLPPPAPAAPVGAIPAFVTADKKLQFGALTITPGGFVAGESVFRSRTTQGDATAFGAIPFPNSALNHMNEERFSARQSRVGLLVEGAVTPTFLASAYGELDFLGAAHTANNVESDSYNPRIRNLYATIDANDYGLHVLAGQSWTLATMNSKGITPRNEVAPPTIEPQFVPGFVWARQPQIRVTKDFDRKLWLSLSAEQAQTSFGACNPGSNVAQAAPGVGQGVTGITCQSAPLGGGGFLDTTTNYSLNHVPDVIGKVAYEASIAGRDVHLEAFGMYRDLYDRVAYTNGTHTNHDTTGYGGGGGLIVPLLPKRLDFQASGLVGRGIGRYGTSTLPDATFAPDGSLTAIPEAIFMSGLTLHATPSFDLYAFGGFERQMATYYANGAGGFYGIGAPTADNSGCFAEGAAGGCTGSTKQIWQITAGFWDKLYKGAYGEVRAGVQYSYTKRELFPSVTGGTFYAPKTDDNIVFTSLRYYPFQ